MEPIVRAHAVKDDTATTQRQEQPPLHISDKCIAQSNARWSGWQNVRSCLVRSCQTTGDKPALMICQDPAVYHQRHLAQHDQALAEAES